MSAIFLVRVSMWYWLHTVCQACMISGLLFGARKLYLEPGTRGRRYPVHESCIEICAMLSYLSVLLCIYIFLFPYLSGALPRLSVEGLKSSPASRKACVMYTVQIFFNRRTH